MCIVMVTMALKPGHTLSYPVHSIMPSTMCVLPRAITGPQNAGTTTVFLCQNWQLQMLWSRDLYKIYNSDCFMVFLTHLFHFRVAIISRNLPSPLVLYHLHFHAAASTLRTSAYFTDIVKELVRGAITKKKWKLG